MIHTHAQDTICAVSSPPGTGGVAIIRVSGPDAIPICDKLFTPGKKGNTITNYELRITNKTEDCRGEPCMVAQVEETEKSLAVLRSYGLTISNSEKTGKQRKNLSDYPANTVVFGTIRTKNETPGQRHAELVSASPLSICSDNETLDEVLATIFRAPHSYTSEDTVEISCHGSTYIQQQLLRLLIENGARTAHPGEFTQRAFLNGKMDLSQAEAVADLIASTSAGMHKLAVNQMRGGFSDELKQLRTQLLDFTSLIELELDFAEEEVEFADRTQLLTLAESIHRKVSCLTDSFNVAMSSKTASP